MIKFFSLLIVVVVVSCSAPSPSAQQIVDDAIQMSGTEVLNNASASFSFRGITYEYSSKDGKYTYTRSLQDSLQNEVKDVLKNDGLIRYINNEEAIITEEKRTTYTASVNSVIYFAFLPVSLNDVAVNKTLEGTVEIKGNSYYKIKVTFDSEGGGEDFEDVFYYWFDTKDYSMDYLAYSYNEVDGKGMRFRVAYNSRKVNGVTIQDYKNLKPKVKESISLVGIDQAYTNGELVELSLIELEDVVISIE
ncbi:DUF6503 family protein [Ekhidna sp.]